MVKYDLELDDERLPKLYGKTMVVSFEAGTKQKNG